MCLYHDDSYDPRELMDEYAAAQQSDPDMAAELGSKDIVTIYDADGATKLGATKLGTAKLGTAKLEVNRFHRRVWRGYWSASNTPIKEKRWDRDFSSVAEVERYMRAMAPKLESVR